MIRWRYQPVYRDDDGDRVYTVCECYFDADHRLESWTENHSMQPQGETMIELLDDLAAMREDALHWHPVAFDDLRVGMTFERTDAEPSA